MQLWPAEPIHDFGEIRDICKIHNPIKLLWPKGEILLTVIGFNNTSDLQLCVRERWPRMPKGQWAISINHRPAKANY